MTRKTLAYSDREAMAALWFKAFLFLPVWAVPLVPLFGAFAWLCGSGAVSLGYAFLLLCAGGYFVEDLLKRRITIDDDKIYFGCRTFRLADLVSMGLNFHRNRAVPNKLVLSFSNGSKLKLALCRLNADDLDMFVALIDTKIPHCEIDPALRTISRCKKLARDTTLDTDELIEVPIESRLIFKQLFDVFMDSGARWKRAGPIICALISAPLWISFTSGLYSSMAHSIAFRSGSSPMDSLKVWTQLTSYLAQIEGQVGSVLNDAATAGGKALGNPVMACVAWVVFLSVIIYLVRFLSKPNVAIMDKHGLSLCQRSYMGILVPLVSIDWKDLTQVCLENADDIEPSERKILFYRKSKSNKPVKVPIGMVAPEYRPRIIKAIRRWAPDAEIQAELSETLLPKQERSYTELWLQSLSSSPERKNLEPLETQDMLHDGRFEVIRRLGVGGQGRAYLCVENAELLGANSQQVVLKETILPVFVQNSVRQQALERFQNEATMLEKLDHDQIVRLLDYFVEDHRGYLVLEHVDGRNLREVIREDGPMLEEDVIDLARQMSEILAYLHEQGMIHRDFTPDNLILGKNRQLKLIDFNVAQNVEKGATGTIVGKHAYVPPEQFRGKPTCQSDIYAFGASLYFLLTGKDPEPITESDPRALMPAVSAEMAELVASCTRLNLNKRIADTTCLTEALSSLSGSPTIIVSAVRETNEVV